MSGVLGVSWFHGFHGVRGFMVSWFQGFSGFICFVVSWFQETGHWNLGVRVLLSFK